MASYLNCISVFVNLVVAPCRSVLSAANRMVATLFRMNVFAENSNAVRSRIEWSPAPTFDTIRPKLRAGAPLTGAEIRFMERQSSFELDALDRSQYGQWKREQFDRLQEKIKEGELLTPFEDEEYEAFIETHIFRSSNTFSVKSEIHSSKF